MHHYTLELYPVCPVTSKVGWQAGAPAVAREAKKEKGKPSFSLWEVETCIKAADLLLWPHIKQAKETGVLASCVVCCLLLSTVMHDSR